MHGACMVRVWCMYGACIWCVYGVCMVHVGACMVHVGACMVRIIMVVYGAYMVVYGACLYGTHVWCMLVLRVWFRCLNWTLMFGHMRETSAGNFVFVFCWVFKIELFNIIIVCLD